MVLMVLYNQYVTITNNNDKYYFIIIIYYTKL